MRRVKVSIFFFVTLFIITCFPNCVKVINSESFSKEGNTQDASTTEILENPVSEYEIKTNDNMPTEDLVCESSTFTNCRVCSPTKLAYITTPSHTSGVYQIIFSPNGKRFATAGYKNPNIRIRESSSGTLLYTLLIPSNQIIALAWSTDGQWIAASSEKNKRISPIKSGSGQY